MSGSQSGCESGGGAGAKGPELRRKRGLVIMPFNVKSGPLRPQEDATPSDVNFDDVWEIFLKPTLNEVLPTTRLDQSFDSGRIDREMFEKLIVAELVVADATFRNANVFYELGVRHAARRAGTIILRQDSGSLPFDISQERVHTYPWRAKRADETEEAYRADLRDLLKDSVHWLKTAARKAIRRREVDSPVDLAGRSLRLVRPSFPVSHVQLQEIDLPYGGGRKLGVFMGDLRHAVDLADVWVNPENTRLRMSSAYETTISAWIRYLSADVSEIHSNRDAVHLSLKREAASRGDLDPAEALITGSGRLRKSHGVRRIAHVAAQIGEPLGGYTTTTQVEQAVWNALDSVDAWNADWRNRFRKPLTRVLLPLFGTRNEFESGEAVASQLVCAVKRYLELNKGSKIEVVYILASTDRDERLLELAFADLGPDFILKPENWRMRSSGPDLERDD